MTDFHYQVATGYDGGGDEYIELHWHPEPPTKEGWYWIVVGSHKPVLVYFHECYADFDCYFEDWGASKQEVSFWLGPLPVPEAPNGEYK